MCGFAGFMSNSAVKFDTSKIIEDMIKTIHHRGPDDDGTWSDSSGSIFFGFKRLAILDLSIAGHQPMESFDERFTIVFNGEIYNHHELRGKLKSSLPNNFEWISNSDTETLLTAFSVWGIKETLRATVGMFALALWDQKFKKLILARDRMGEKPLYFGNVDRSFVFASELKAIKAFPNFNNSISKNSLKEFLKYNYIPAPHSIYENIYKLMPGSYATIHQDGSFHHDYFWSVNETFKQGSLNMFSSSAEAIEQIEENLSESISLQMLADVPLGAFLSGGVDSSTIVALMQEKSINPIKTFTIAFEDDNYNEAPFAKEIANHLETDHHEILVTDAEVQDVIPKLSSMYDEPFADSSQIPTHLVCKAARKNVTVALSGDAADELFGGYNRYTWTPRIWKKVSWMPFKLRRIIGKLIKVTPSILFDFLGGLVNILLPKRKKIMRFSDKFHKMAARLETSKNLSDFCHHLALIWQNPEEVINMTNFNGINQTLQNTDNDFIATDDVSQMMYDDLITYLPDDILCKVDRAAMSVSLETRVPFLDHRIIETSARIPIEMKIQNNKGKWILREILNKYVPSRLIDRPKAGFAVPIGDWIKGPLKKWAEALIEPNRLINEGYLNPEPIQKIWKEHLSGEYDWTPRLWGILMFQSWLEKTKKD